MKPASVWTTLLSVSCLIVAQCSCLAQEQSFAGKRVEITVGYSAGGGPDLAARIVARHLGRFLTGTPAVIVRNMPGAEAVLQANFMANIAPVDGLSIAYMSRASALQQLSDRPGVKFDLASFRWIGGFSQQNILAFIRRDRGYGSLDQIKASSRRVVFAARSPGSTDFLAGKALEALGLPINIVTGYEGGQTTFAFESGEVDCSALTREALKQRASWFKPGGIALPLVEFGSLRPEPGIAFGPDLHPVEARAAVYSMINRALGLAVGAFAGPPGMSAPTLEMFRTAFGKMMQDEQFLMDAERANIDVNALSGSRLENLFREFLHSSPEMKREFIALVR
jgi:tripartite-type tricarboxylate transporter receptor subunit TctC